MDSHERERVARLDDARLQLVVEAQRPFDELILEVHVRGGAGKPVGDLAEREIVRRDETDRAGSNQAREQRLRADPAIVRIRAAQDLVEQEQHARPSALRPRRRRWP